MSEENRKALDIIVGDIHDLRTEMRESFHRIDARLDSTIGRCVDNCPKVFASRADLATVHKWVKGCFLGILVLILVFIITHGEPALQAFERIMKMI